MTTFTPMDEVISRKRKQEPANLSDYVYSSPNSPSLPVNLPTSDVMDHGHGLGFDSMLNSFEYPAVTDFQQQPFMHHVTDQFTNGHNSRRHSVAIGDLDYHHYHTLNAEMPNSYNNDRFDYVKQEPLDSLDWGNSDFQHLLGGDGDHGTAIGGTTSIPSSFSSHSSGTTFDSMGTLDYPPATHQRTMSLRLENLSSYHDHTTAASASPTTPVFFSPSFLDSLSTSTEEDGNSFTNHSFVDSMSMAGPAAGITVPSANGGFATTTTTTDNQGLPSDFMVHPEQLAMFTANTTNQQQQPSGMWAMESIPNATKRQSISKRRPSGSSKSNKSPPPSSPANTMSTCSPSPPITPSQHINGFDSFHHAHPSIPEEDDDTATTTTARKAKAKVTKPRKSTPTATTRRAANSADDDIDDEDDNAIEHRTVAERRAKNSLVSARIIQGANTATQLKPLIQQYLLSDNPSACGEHSITLLSSKVAQKSYGTEKRFLCPPPTTILSGASWWTSNVDGQDDIATTKFYRSSSSLSGGSGGDGTLCAPKLTIHISGEPTSQNGSLEWHHANGSVIDNTSSLAAAANASSLGQATISGKCVSKQLHINDADEKRRRVEVMAKIQLGNGLHLGTLASKGIKVISKPSKKRQSVKNMELCIHHGTTVSLFNRIRSQTVSTKYLGVSNGESSSSANDSTGACFVARTSSWDPFVIWIVDTSRSPELASTTQPTMHHHPLNPDFPPPPAIALQSGLSPQDPVALHYNQPVVLQCVSTGLVSPVMVIRKVDKGSAVLGGNRVEDLSGITGGECGDEAIGDPVSQLHKIAFQIVQDPSVAYHNKANYYPHPHIHHPTMTAASSDWTLPHISHPVTYLACLNDVVGMHKTTTPRTLISTRPPASPSTPTSTQISPWATSTSSSLLYDNANDLSSVVSSEIEPAGKVVRKRRVSCDVVGKSGNHLVNSKFTLGGGANFGKPSSSNSQRRRVNSLNDVPTKATTSATTTAATTTADGNIGSSNGGRRGSVAADRRTSISSDNGNPVDGNCWTEDVSDAAVWTIVGTETLTYTFWTPPTTATTLSTSSSPSSSSMSQQLQQHQQQQDDGDDDTSTIFNNPFTNPHYSHPITPFPVIDHVNAPTSSTMMISGENLARDLTVWFGDVKAPSTEYKSRDLLSCNIPDESELAASLVTRADEDDAALRKLPILLVRGDGVVYRTGQFYTF
ncbi:hypothetical protein BCR42DRAFT_451836 [Absidia repens]|uniref:LAG1-DNAbind-domain-containing protein n=1 Tax=Absidia repens TaxID=90262 RepID=A0A1X2IG69_9FUNG|nr:hypothetical protein BCR42DRAFT_451836 [Absidia repens]